MKKGTEKFDFILNGNLIEKNCHFVATRYENPNNYALLVVNENDEEVCICTANPKRLKYDLLPVKDWSENTGMVEFLVEKEIIESKCDWFESEESGFVVINSYELAEKGKKLFENI